jgi:hypothetical protein
MARKGGILKGDIFSARIAVEWKKSKSPIQAHIPG